MHLRSCALHALRRLLLIINPQLLNPIDIDPFMDASSASSPPLPWPSSTSDITREESSRRKAFFRDAAHALADPLDTNDMLILLGLVRTGSQADMHRAWSSFLASRDELREQYFLWIRDKLEHWVRGELALAASPTTPDVEAAVVHIVDITLDQGGLTHHHCLTEQLLRQGFDEWKMSRHQAIFTGERTPTSSPILGTRTSPPRIVEPPAPSLQEPGKEHQIPAFQSDAELSQSAAPAGLATSQPCQPAQNSVDEESILPRLVDEKSIPRLVDETSIPHTEEATSVDGLADKDTAHVVTHERQQQTSLRGPAKQSDDNESPIEQETQMQSSGGGDDLDIKKLSANRTAGLGSGDGQTVTTIIIPPPFSRREPRPSGHTGNVTTMADHFWHLKSTFEDMTVWYPHHYGQRHPQYLAAYYKEHGSKFDWELMKYGEGEEKGMNSDGDGQATFRYEYDHSRELHVYRELRHQRWERVLREWLLPMALWLVWYGVLLAAFVFGLASTLSKAIRPIAVAAAVCIAIACVWLLFLLDWNLLDERIVCGAVQMDQNDQDGSLGESSWAYNLLKRPIAHPLGTSAMCLRGCRYVLYSVIFYTARTAMCRSDLALLHYCPHNLVDAPHTTTPLRDWESETLWILMVLGLLYILFNVDDAQQRHLAALIRPIWQSDVWNGLIADFTVHISVEVTEMSWHQLFRPMLTSCASLNPSFHSWSIAATLTLCLLIHIYVGVTEPYLEDEGWQRGMRSLRLTTTLLALVWLACSTVQLSRSCTAQMAPTTATGSKIRPTEAEQMTNHEAQISCSRLYSQQSNLTSTWCLARNTTTTLSFWHPPPLHQPPQSNKKNHGGDSNDDNDEPPPPPPPLLSPLTLYKLALTANNTLPLPRPTTTTQTLQLINTSIILHEARVKHRLLAGLERDLLEMVEDRVRRRKKDKKKPIDKNGNGNNTVHPFLPLPLETIPSTAVPLECIVVAYMALRTAKCL